MGCPFDAATVMTANRSKTAFIRKGEPYIYKEERLHWSCSLESNTVPAADSTFWKGMAAGTICCMQKYLRNRYFEKRSEQIPAGDNYAVILFSAIIRRDKAGILWGFVSWDKTAGRWIMRYLERRNVEGRVGRKWLCGKKIKDEAGLNPGQIIMR